MALQTDTVNGTKELEIEFSDFNDTAEIIEKLGYTPRGRQESKRKRWMLDDVEIDIDTWPVIPAYIEIEGKDEESIKLVCEKLNLDYRNACTMNILDIVKKIYKIPEDKLDNVSFGETK